MKAAVLTQFGKAEKAFTIKEVEKPKPQAGQVLLQAEGFGLNYADIMAMQGDYQDCPPLPAIIGYDVVGKVVEINGDCGALQVGDRVAAMTRFGAYAQYVVAESIACIKLTADTDMGKAMALGTQYATAYYCLHHSVNLQKGDKVLVQSAAGGVGTALVQMALAKGCEVFGTCGSADKIEYLKSMGVQHPINYNTQDFYQEIKKITGDYGLDAVFDAVGGSSAKKGFKLLGSGGRLVLYGVASMTDTTIIGKLKMMAGFGLYHPVQFMMSSKAIIGVNMLRIADDRPQLLQQIGQKVAEMLAQGTIKPTVAKIFPVEELAEALNFLKSRKSMGKISVVWE